MMSHKIFVKKIIVKKKLTVRLDIQLPDSGVDDVDALAFGLTLGAFEADPLCVGADSGAKTKKNIKYKRKNSVKVKKFNAILKN